jgi:hypothetical protein
LLDKIIEHIIKKNPILFVFLLEIRTKKNKKNLKANFAKFWINSGAAVLDEFAYTASALRRSAVSAI